MDTLNAGHLTTKDSAYCPSYIEMHTRLHSGYTSVTRALGPAPKCPKEVEVFLYSNLSSGTFYVG